MGATCRTCQKPIIWTRTTKGKLMPVDPEPVSGGNVVLTSGNDAPTSEVVGPKEAARRRDLGLLLHVSHFSTCASADEHRRG